MTAPTLDVAPQAVLEEVFGYPSFRGRQGAVIEHVVNGGDALVLMPTGGGKSVCYQVPAVALHRSGRGTTLVVSPLIALMHDQVTALAELGVHAAFLNSTLAPAEARRIEGELERGALALVYAAPERLTTPRFLSLLDGLHARGGLALFAIDEAHCVSQWGHDFREEYLELRVLHDRYPGVPRLALTATADAQTREEIVERLHLDDARRFVASFDRPNIAYEITERGANPRAQLLRLLRDEHDGDAAIVYCATRRKVEETATWLAEQGIRALPYHAGLDAATRLRHQELFRHEDGVVIVATIAFGMGIDKPDVRLVAHLDLPKTVEGYYQETGRAGRDGLPARAWMTYGLADVVNNRRLIDESTAGEEFKRLQRSKLDALLALAEAHDCRRARLLAAFGEEADPCAPPQRLCDNCARPPETWDATEEARKLLSCVFRIAEHGSVTGGPMAFGAGHLLDVLRGRRTEKVTQHRHDELSTFGIGADISEQQWRALLRQLVASGVVSARGEFGTLGLTPEARAVLRGEVPIALRVQTERPARSRSRRAAGTAPRAGGAELPAEAAARFEALRAWRAGVARERGLPAYVVFHDATLVEIAQRHPLTLEELARVAGVGAHKLEAYGTAILEVLHGDP